MAAIPVAMAARITDIEKRYFVEHFFWYTFKLQQKTPLVIEIITRTNYSRLTYLKNVYCNIATNNGCTVDSQGSGIMIMWATVGPV